MAAAAASLASFRPGRMTEWREATRNRVLLLRWRRAARPSGASRQPEERPWVGTPGALRRRHPPLRVLRAEAPSEATHTPRRQEARRAVLQPARGRACLRGVLPKRHSDRDASLSTAEHELTAYLAAGDRITSEVLSRAFTGVAKAWTAGVSSVDIRFAAQSRSSKCRQQRASPSSQHEADVCCCEELRVNSSARLTQLLVSPESPSL